MSNADLPATPGIPQEEFEKFLHAFTHEIRNRLNSIALEAADLAEAAGSQADSSRLQRQIQECSSLLKIAREALAPDDSQVARITPSEFVKTIRDTKI